MGANHKVVILQVVQICYCIRMKKIALLLGITGAVLLAVDVGLNLLAFCLMLAQSLYWVKTLWANEREAALLNAAFSVINIIGIVRVLL